MKYFTRLFFASLAFSLSAFCAETEKVKVGSSPALSSAGIFLAQELGYFKEEGIEVELTVFGGSSAPMVPLLAKGELDVGGGVLTAGILNAAQAGDIRIVADKGKVLKGKSYISLLVRADLIRSGRFKTLKDLKGFRMPVSSFGGSSHEITTEAFLKKAGLKMEDVTLVKMSYPEANAALEKKMLDAAVQLEPYLTQSVLAGHSKVVATVYDVQPGHQSAAIFYGKEFAAKRPEVAAKFMRAYVKGVRAYDDAFLHGKGTAEAIAMLKRHVEIDNNVVWEKMTPTGLDPDGRLDLPSLRSDLRWYQEKKYLAVAPELEKMVDASFQEAAVRQLGQYRPKKKGAAR